MSNLQLKFFFWLAKVQSNISFMAVHNSFSSNEDLLLFTSEIQ